MKIANLHGAAVTVAADGTVSPLRMDSDAGPIVKHVLTAAGLTDPSTLPDAPVAPETLDAPVWGCRNVYGLGFNYRSHVAEGTGDREPLAFLKATASLARPHAQISIDGPQWDFEVELVLVIGAQAHRVPDSRAWRHVGAVMIGQDISDRALQRTGQLCMSKSMAAAAPVGPWLVTADELGSLDEVAIQCWVGDELLQDSRLGEMVWSPAEIVSRFSHWTRLEPGDLIFTGTPAGVGLHRSPQRFLGAGDVVTSSIEGIGRMVNECV